MNQVFFFHKLTKLVSVCITLDKMKQMNNFTFVMPNFPAQIKNDNFSAKLANFKSIEMFSI